MDKHSTKTCSFLQWSLKGKNTALQIMGNGKDHKYQGQQVGSRTAEANREMSLILYPWRNDEKCFFSIGKAVCVCGNVFSVFSVMFSILWKPNRLREGESSSFSIL